MRHVFLTMCLHTISFDLLQIFPQYFKCSVVAAALIVVLVEVVANKITSVWKFQITILSRSQVHSFDSLYTHNTFWVISTLPSIFSEKLTWIPFAFLERSNRYTILNTLHCMYTVNKLPNSQPLFWGLWGLTSPKVDLQGLSAILKTAQNFDWIFVVGYDGLWRGLIALNWLLTLEEP